APKLPDRGLVGGAHGAVQLAEGVDLAEVLGVPWAAQRGRRGWAELAGAPQDERSDVGRLREPGGGECGRSQLVLTGSRQRHEHRWRRVGSVIGPSREHRSGNPITEPDAPSYAL